MFKWSALVARREVCLAESAKRRCELCETSWSAPVLKWTVLRARYEIADEMFREALEIRRDVLEDPHEELAAAWTNWGHALLARGKVDGPRSDGRSASCAFCVFSCQGVLGRVCPGVSGGVHGVLSGVRVLWKGDGPQGLRVRGADGCWPFGRAVRCCATARD